MRTINKLIIVLFLILNFGSSSFAENNFFEEGKNKYNEQKYEESKFLFQRSIVFNPKDKDSYLYLAKIYNFEENKREEQKNIDTVLLLDPKNEEANYMLMEIELKRSNYSKVKELADNFSKICNKLCDKKNSILESLKNQWKQIAIHSKSEPGRFRTDSSHIPGAKVSAVERGTDALLRQIAAIGPHTKAWSESVIQSRGVQGVRVLAGLKALAGRHQSDALEQACETALTYGANRLKSIRNLLKRPASQIQQPLPFIEEHPIIRPLSDYSVESLNAFRKERDHEHDTP